MQQQIRKTIALEVSAFHLPRFDDIPNVGLYLEQTVHYICEYLEPLYHDAVTGSMISNYVKRRMIASPLRKQYGREQIAELLFITVAKAILSLDNIAVLLQIRKERYGIREAYNEFCRVLELAVGEVFGLPAGESAEGDGENACPAVQNEDREILQSTLTAAANKLYLEHWIAMYAEQE